MFKKFKDYQLRLAFVLCGFVLIYIVIVVRLFLLQIYQQNFFKELALNQYQISMKINMPRGVIYDRTGQCPLAFNCSAQSAFILPHQFTETKKIEHFLKHNYPAVYKKLKNHPEKYFFWVDRVLSDFQIKKIKSYNLKDIIFIDEPRRVYPSAAAAHLIGFSDIDGRGISGIEIEFEQWLAGKQAHLTVQRDARSNNFYFEKNIDKIGAKGNPLVLTIDGKLQTLAFEALKDAVEHYQAISGSVLVMDPETGQVLTMANYPTFNPNQKGITDLSITKNFIVTECFELGSVMKVFLAMSGFAEKVVTSDEIFDCEGKIAYVNGFKVENWKSLGVMPFSDCIKFSSNVVCAKVSTRLGSKLYDHLTKIGFGVKTGIELPGERNGFVNPPSRWSRSSPLVMSFGYEITASLLQLGRAFCVFSNGGYLVQPTIVLEPKKNGQYPKKTKIYDDEIIQEMRSVLKGIGDLHHIKGCLIMGKTGTARCAQGHGYSQSEHLYTFAGIVEKGDYKRVIVTFINRPQKVHLWASEVAAPLFQRVAERMILLDAQDKKQIMI
ncbi:MAG: Peptidoglycan transglycosylase and transpeptidase FtsI [candidate division TM6 bacterium GW2011_GWF2_37_49]|nr:MAG: Peptidoglycan transglycosylase and transpeptidase FtsI [candidate division TM6 bacterium GW2011_GWF2_37_49]